MYEFEQQPKLFYASIIVNCITELSQRFLHSNVVKLLLWSCNFTIQVPWLILLKAIVSLIHLNLEEQEVFLTPAYNKTSREVFGLIKKVNVSSTVKKKPKLSSGMIFYCLFHCFINEGLIFGYWSNMIFSVLKVLQNCDWCVQHSMK